MEKTDKIYVAGHRGLVGSAIVRSLKEKGYENVIGRTHRELDLTNQAAVREFFQQEKPDVVVLAAAKVGGINANNTAPAEFAYENMQIQCNVIKSSHDYKVKKLLFLGSTCIYPKLAPSLFRKMRFLPDHWKKQMRHMPLPRFPVWKCVNFSKDSTAMTLSAVCPLICMVRKIIMIYRVPMLCLQ